MINTILITKSIAKLCGLCGLKAFHFNRIIVKATRAESRSRFCFLSNFINIINYFVSKNKNKTAFIAFTKLYAYSKNVKNSILTTQTKVFFTEYDL